MVTETAAPYCRLDIPYPAAAGPGGVFRIIGFTTPVDEGNCLVFFWRLRKATGLAREVWRFLYRATLEARGTGTCWSRTARCSRNMPADARKREMLYQHDVGVARIRQALVRKAQGAARRAGRRRRALGGVARHQPAFWPNEANGHFANESKRAKAHAS